MAEPTTDAAVEQHLGSGPVPAETEQPEVKEQPEKVEAKTEGDETEPAVEHTKRKGGWQRKIEKLEQEVELWRGQALKTQSSSPTDKPASGPAKPSVPKLSTFKGTVEEFDAAQVKYEEDLETYNQGLVQQRITAQKAEQATQGVVKQLEAMDDYEAIEEASQEYLPKEVIKPLQSECAMLKNGAEVFRFLVMDPDERESLLQMLEMQDYTGIKLQVRSIGIALRKQSAVVPPKATTRAPKPPTPVTKPAPTDTGLSDDLPVDEWVRRREAAMKR